MANIGSVIFVSSGGLEGKGKGRIQRVEGRRGKEQPGTGRKNSVTLRRGVKTKTHLLYWERYQGIYTRERVII